MNRRMISYSLILVVSILYSSLSYALITSSDDVASRYELVGIISSNVVVLKDKQTGSSLTRRLGEPLSQELKISKIGTSSITLTSSAIGEDFTLTFDKFGSTVATNTPAPAPAPARVATATVPDTSKTPGYSKNPSSHTSSSALPDTLGSANIANSELPPVPAPTPTTSSSATPTPVPGPGPEVAASEEVPSVSELSPETLNMLDKFYEDPDSFSPEQIKDLEKRLLEGI